MEDSAMPRPASWFCLLFVLSVTLSAQTIVDSQPVKELKATGSLGTCGYTPSPREQPFFDKLEAKERSTGSFMEPYDIHKRDGKFVSWFGIVRGISRVPNSESWDLLLEH
jgi:hypothetical protein